MYFLVYIWLLQNAGAVKIFCLCLNKGYVISSCRYVQLKSKTRNELYSNATYVILISSHTVVTAFFMSTETHAKRFLTVWKRSVSTTFKRSFTVLANQIIVSETFQAFQILTNHISVRKTLSWKPCLVSNVLAFAELANQNPADSIYFTSFFFFFFFFFFPISLNYNCYKINKKS